MKNPWTQQQITTQKPTYGVCYNILRQKYKLDIQETNYKEQQQQYKQIVEYSNNIQELKQKLAIQIVDQQFGDMVDPIKFENRIQSLCQLQNIVDQIIDCLNRCKICIQHNDDTINYIRNESSIYINIAFQFKTQFFQILREAEQQKQLLNNPDTIIVEQTNNLKVLNETCRKLDVLLNQIIEFLKQMKYQQ